MDLLAALERRFSDALGINTAALGRAAVERIVSQAVRRSGAADADDYLALLSASPQEAERCLEELVVPETWFFRDREPFNLLLQHLRGQWFPAHPGEAVRILSLPCSTGEEPYSIAITLLGAGIAPSQFHLDAADISTRVLAAAALAEYGQGAFREPLTPLQESFFTPLPRGGRRVAEAASRTVHFRRENLVDKNLLQGCKPYHVIFCRNVLIYMTEAARGKVLANIDRLLAPEGLLFTGHAEMGILQQQGYAALRHPRAFACRRSEKPLPKGVGSEGSLQRMKGTLPGRDGVEICLSAKGGSPRPVARTGRTAPKKSVPAGDKSGRVMGRDLKSPPLASIVPPVPEMPVQAAVGALHAEALALADRGLFDEAETLCRRYLQEQAPHADVYCLLGLINEAARRLEGAEECYLRSLYLDPGHYEALIHLSLLYRQRGDSRRASLLNRRAEAAQRRPDGTDGP